MNQREPSGSLLLWARRQAVSRERVEIFFSQWNGRTRSAQAAGRTRTPAERKLKKILPGLDTSGNVISCRGDGGSRPWEYIITSDKCGVLKKAGTCVIIYS